MPTFLAPPCRADQIAFDAQEQMRYARLVEERQKQYRSQGCCEEIQLTFFFDGTNNNAKRDGPQNCQSNVARLHDVHPPDGKLPGAFRIYIPGVGTAFSAIGDTGADMDKTGGLAMAYKGEQRIVWALLQSLNSVQSHFFPGTRLTSPDEDRKLCEQLTSAIDNLDIVDGLVVLGGFYRLFTKGAIKRREIIDRKRREKLLSLTNDLWQKVSYKNIGRTPHVMKIRVSIFGFSRGAAEARCFANWFVDMCRQSSGGLGMSLGGIDVVMDFLGIFDTVASVGLANSSIIADGHMEWADTECNLRVPPEIKRCVHFVAPFEARRSFPLDSVSVGSNLKEGWDQFVYPGVHSDVGGGYRPKEQGRGFSDSGDDMLSRVPLGHMYREARLAGVPLSVNAPGVTGEAKEAMKVDVRVRTAFNRYLDQCKVGKQTDKDNPARLQDILWEQTCFHVRWRKLRLDTMASIPSVKRSGEQDRADILSANDELKEEIARLYRGDRSTPLLDQTLQELKNNRYARYASNVNYMAKTLIYHTDKLKFALMPIVRRAMDRRDADWIRLQPVWEGKGIHQGPLHEDIVTLFDEFVHDSRAWFKPFGVDDAEWEEEKKSIAKARRDRMAKRLAELEQRDAQQKRLEKTNPKELKRGGLFSEVPLSAEERKQMEGYREELKKPFSWELQKTGREPFDIGGGYMRLRHVYYGFDDDLDALENDRRNVAAIVDSGRKNAA
jgi:hypothetical protein